MANQMLLSALRDSEHVLRAHCSRSGECFTAWEVDLDHAIQSFGDIPLAALRRRLSCPRCNAPITTTLALLGHPKNKRSS